MKEVKGKMALITGGTRGIGFATAIAFLKEGATVAVCGEKKATVAMAKQKLGKRGEALVLKADVRKREDIKKFINAAVRKFGRIDILVNNAGVLHVGEFRNEKSKHIDHQLDVNLRGVLNVTRAVLPIMLRQKNGTIINVASGLGKSGIANFATYCATKFAVVGFTESLAQELLRKGIRVFGICPGQVATDMQIQAVGKKVGMPPEKIANNIVTLAGPNPPIQPGDCLKVYR